MTTKLEELKAAWEVADEAASDAWDNARADTWAAWEVADAAACAAWAAYQEELKKQENTNDYRKTGA